MRVDKTVCRKKQGVAELGNTCLTTPGTCESCPDWVDKSRHIRHYMHASTQREGFKELWNTWIERWGRVQAADAVLMAMAEYEASYQDLRELVLKRQREKRQRKHVGVSH
jgi:hypothetical protein